MNYTTLIIFGAALIASGIAGYQGHLGAGLSKFGKLSYEVFPLICVSLLLAGMIQVILPESGVSMHLGDDSGLRGIVIGALAGIVSPGGVYVNMPIAAGMMSAGAGIGCVVSYVTSWSTFGVYRLIYEAGVMGWKFAILRLVSTIWLPVVAGVFAAGIVRLLK